MTVLADQSTGTKNPRDLVSPELFANLVARVKEHLPVATFYAEHMVEQMLMYVAAAAVYDPANPPACVPAGEPFPYLTPSEEVDTAVHYFLDFTADWREFTGRLTGGKFTDHVPITNESITSGRSLELTRGRYSPSSARADHHRPRICCSISAGSRSGHLRRWNCRGLPGPAFNGRTSRTSGRPRGRP